MKLRVPLALLAVLLLLMPSAVETTKAAAPVNLNPTNYTMVGISGSQTLQLNITAWPPGPCMFTAELGFLNNAGDPIGKQLTISISPGQTASLQLAGSSVTSGATERAEVVPYAVPTVGTETSCSVSSSLELIDSLGLTIAVLPGSVAWPPVPPFGSTGLAPTEALRLNVVAPPGFQCDATLSFDDGNGNALGTSMGVKLDTAGESASLDYVAPLGTPRTVVHPVVTVLAGSTEGCLGSSEVYSTITGGTIYFWPPNPCSPAATTFITINEPLSSPSLLLGQEFLPEQANRLLG
jgi:hypothetical protein